MLANAVKKSNRSASV